MSSTIPFGSARVLIEVFSLVRNRCDWLADDDEAASSAKLRRLAEVRYEALFETARFCTTSVFDVPRDRAYCEVVSISMVTPIGIGVAMRPLDLADARLRQLCLHLFQHCHDDDYECSLAQAREHSSSAVIETLVPCRVVDPALSSQDEAGVTVSPSAALENVDAAALRFSLTDPAIIFNVLARSCICRSSLHLLTENNLPARISMRVTEVIATCGDPRRTHDFLIELADHMNYREKDGGKAMDTIRILQRDLEFEFLRLCETDASGGERCGPQLLTGPPPTLEDGLRPGVPTERSLSEEKQALLMKLSDIYHTLGSCVHSIGRFADAALMHLRAILLKKAAFGSDDHYSVAASANNCGNAYISLGRYREAQSILNHSLEIKVRILPANDIDIASTEENLSICARHLGDYASAEALNESSLRKKRAHYGNDTDPHVALGYTNLAVLWFTMCQYRRALEQFRQVMRIDQAFYGHVGTDSGIDSVNISMCLFELGGGVESARECLDAARNAYHWFVGQYGAGHLDAQFAVFSLANARAWMQSFSNDEAAKRRAQEERRDTLTGVLAIREQALGEHNIDIAHTRLCLADAHQRLGSPAAALELLALVERCYRAVSETDPKLVRVLVVRARCQRDMGDEQETQRTLDAAMLIAREHRNDWLVQHVLHFQDA